MLCRRITERGYWGELEQAAIRAVTAGGMAGMGYYREAADQFAGSRKRKADPTLDQLIQEYAAQKKNPPTWADLESTAAILRMADSLLVPIAADLICGLSYMGEEAGPEAYRAWLEQTLGNNLARRVHRPEYFFSAETNVLRVILDGLDGTANFNRGLPLFSTAAAILGDAEPRVAAVYDPIHNEVYAAVLAGPPEQAEDQAWASVWEVPTGRRIDLIALARGRPSSKLKREAVVVHLPRGDPAKRAEFLVRLETLAEASGAIYALNSGLLAMAHVARGGLGAFVNNYTNLWDVAAGEVLVRASGGKVTDFGGSAIRYDSERRISMVAAKAQLHADVLRALRGEAEATGSGG